MEVAAAPAQSLRTLSTDGSGKQIFVPTNYYWWGFFYRKSTFAKWGVQEPKTWNDFLALCETLKSKGIPPIGIGLGDTPWMASAWFDYLDLRINGAPFHRELLAGKHRFDDPRSRWSSPAGARPCPTSTPRAGRTPSRRPPPR